MKYFGYFFLGLLRFLIGFLFGIAIGTALFLASDAKAATNGEIFAITTEVEHLSRVYQMDPALVMAVIDVESHFNVRQRGSHGEVGLMQLRPNFFPGVAYDIRGNIETGVSYLSFVRANCPTKVDNTWITCYNNGISRKPKYPKLLPYYKAVMNAYKKYSTAEVHY